MAKQLPEFIDMEQQEAYLANLKRELEGCELRGDEEYADTVRAEIKRVEGSKPGPKPKPKEEK